MPEGLAATAIRLTADLARTVMRVVGFEGQLVFDRSKPDGTPRKLLDVSRLAALGWRARTPLEEGIRLAYRAAPFHPEATCADAATGAA